MMTHNIYRQFLFIGLVFILPGLLQMTYGQGELINDSIFSPSVNKVKSFNIWIPNVEDKNELPVIYMLHGAWGNYNNWTDKTDILKHPLAEQVIMVFIDGENSFYVNSAYHADQRYEDYIINDLIPTIEDKYAIDSRKRGIAGLSMGGYGSLYLAFRHPDVFTFCGSLSGAVSIPLMSYLWQEDKENKELVRDIVKNAFGLPDTSIYKNYDLMYILEQNQDIDIPYVYMVHGKQDGFKDFLPAHRLLVEKLSHLDVKHEYQEVDGKHNWTFWNNHIGGVLTAYHSVISK